MRTVKPITGIHPVVDPSVIYILLIGPQHLVYTQVPWSNIKVGILQDSQSMLTVTLRSRINLLCVYSNLYVYYFSLFITNSIAVDAHTKSLFFHCTAGSSYPQPSKYSQHVEKIILYRYLTLYSLFSSLIVSLVSSL